MTLTRAGFLRRGLGAMTLCAAGRAPFEWSGAYRRPQMRGSVFNVRDFGARGDGRADDAHAIQSALDAVSDGLGTLGVAPYTAGGVVYVPASNRPYVIGHTLVITRGLVLTGDGPGSMLYLADGVSEPMVRVAHGGNTWAEVTWLALEGNRFQQRGSSSHGIVVEAGQTLARYHDLFMGLYVRNCRGNGLEFVDGAPHRIVNCTFNDNSVAQIHHGPKAIDNYVLNTIVGTDAAEQDTTGWWCEGSTNLWMGGAAALSGVGMLITGLRNSVVGGASVDSNRRHGIVLQGNETRISDLVFRNNSRGQPGGYDDVYIDGSTGKGFRNVISACVIDGGQLASEPGKPQARYGVQEAGGAAGNRVVGCVVTGHTEADVQLTGEGSFADHRIGSVEVPFNGEVVIDAQWGDTFRIVLGGNVTRCDIIHPLRGQRIRIVLRQNAQGGRRFAWPANVRLAGGELSPSPAGRADVVTLSYDGDTWMEEARVQNVG